jgi:hypothetical protein
MVVTVKSINSCLLTCPSLIGEAPYAAALLALHRLVDLLSVVA